jgi:hypothetical protein
MRAIWTHGVGTALALAVVAALAGRLTAGHGGEVVKFPEKYAEGGRYATVERATSRRRSSRAAQPSTRRSRASPSRAGP